MGYLPGDQLIEPFPTQNPANGTITDATGTPLATFYHNGVLDAAVGVTVTHPGPVGAYVATCTIPATYAGGDKIAVFVTATVAGIAGGNWIYDGPLDRTSPVTSVISATSPAVVNQPRTKTFTQNDRRTNIGDQLVDAFSNPINLSGSTVTFHMISQVDNSIKVNYQAANIDDPPNGKVSYTWQTNDLNTVGRYWYWFRVNTSGQTEHFPGDGNKFTVNVVQAY